MAWLYVFLAGVVEIVWVFCLANATSVWMWILTAALIMISFYLIMKAAEKLPVGTVYMVFTGMGTTGIVLIDRFYHHIPLSPAKIVCVCLIIAGIIGIKMTEGKLEKETAEEGSEL